MKYIFDVPDMSCEHCKMNIEKQLKSSGVVQDFKVDLENKKVEVETLQEPEKIVNLLDEIGYPPKLVSKE
ncbi:heavy-metal-associated domain-containing protein [Petrotoga olearia]|uniref:Heavy metal transporter n=2 Tax=Petrotoga olearia TaxID=156203 RepID=A0A2K1P439_9BACT|nr:heavy-metal-associated domain-containing protein [Petrotoga olearia]PNR97559.1 heavy metal transporter [Petrotoga olearia DSM 13574]RMA75286.1 copper chaperone [Petrotoga olearia]